MSVSLVKPGAYLSESYAEGLIDKQEFEPRVTHMRARLQHLEAQMQYLKAEGEIEEELRLIMGRLETFAAQVHNGLQQADFHTRREIMRSLDVHFISSSSVES